MFVFIVGHGGMQLKMWQFCRDLLEDVKIEYVFNYLKNKISPLRLQGFLDHSYGEYQETKREDFEKNWKKKEKQIDLIIQNSLHISGSIEGIAGQDTIDMQLNSNENLIDNE